MRKTIFNRLKIELRHAATFPACLEKTLLLLSPFTFINFSQTVVKKAKTVFFHLWNILTKTENI